MTDVKSILKQCEDDVRAGRGHVVKRQLGSLNAAQVPRDLRLPLANVARRAGLFAVGMRFLSPLMQRERNRWQSIATSPEIAEYAVLLQKLGAVDEALKTLASVNTAAVPDAHLYRAFCHFNLWQFSAAIPALKLYLASDISPYWNLVGHVNLAAALISIEENDAAKEIVEASIGKAVAGGFSRLHANCLELRAQIQLHANDLAKAEADLEAASRLLNSEQTLDQLFVRKWQAILESMRTGSSESLIEFKTEAVARSHWESVREADFYSLKQEFDSAAFKHLLAGTPFSDYRARICRDLAQPMPIGQYRLGAKGSACMNISDGEIDGLARINSGKKVHQVLEVLLRDFYRPRRLGSLFSELFPGEYFDIHSSPDRVHQILRRARRWLESSGIPVKLEETNGNYSLKVTGDFSFLIPFERRPILGNHQVLANLERCFAGSVSFSAREAREKLNMPLTSFNRFLVWAIEASQLDRVGSGQSTRYRLTAANTKKSSAA